MTNVLQLNGKHTAVYCYYDN